MEAIRKFYEVELSQVTHFITKVESYLSLEHIKVRG